jgi:hypothetical protein
LEPYPHLQPDEISVRQAGDLPSPFSRFHLAMDTLGVWLYPSRYRNVINLKWDKMDVPTRNKYFTKRK